MPLDRNWVERIHTRLLARYGSAWIGRYRDIDPELVIADWADALNGFGAAAIKYAFECLPDDHPPNSAQFARLCLRGPQNQAPALPWPAAHPEIVATVMAGIKPPPTRGMKQWARDLQTREANGDRLTLAQRTMWRAAVDTLNAARDGQEVPTQMITAALRHTGDIAAHD